MITAGSFIVFVVKKLVPYCYSSCSSWWGDTAQRTL